MNATAVQTTATTAAAPMSINFETTECGRCGGTGFHGPAIVHNGVCFSCSGGKYRLTRRGANARQAYDALRNERLTVPATDLQVGDRVLSPAHSVRTIMGGLHKTKWRTVKAVRVTETQVDVDFEGDPELHLGYHFSIEGPGAFLHTPEYKATLQGIMIEVAKRFKGAWLEGQEPPAKAAPKPRAPKAEQAPKPVLAVRAFPNKFTGQCAKDGCGAVVEAGTGECFKDGGRWIVQHAADMCPEATSAPQAAPTAPAPVPVTEEGMYRHGETIYRVARSESGNLYAKEFIPGTDGSGASFQYAPGAIRDLSAADRLTADEAAEISRALKTCVVCARRLTNPKSVAQGVGPVCRKRV
ncbi:DUF6011 domain-containing protein [Streptomyces sp. NPDC059761]|uniref:DUF6011 domain-containing protein n=1 Tax=Streptomyces sp. NPDC059761 TaxID=3346937 RepID=UPI003652D86C